MEETRVLGTGVEEGTRLSFVPCEGEFLLHRPQFGAESTEDVVLLISLPPISNIADSSSNWVLDKVNEIQQCVQITCEGFEDQFIALLTAIEAGHVLGTKSRSKKSRELKRLTWTINHDDKGCSSSRGRTKGKTEPIVYC